VPSYNKIVLIGNLGIDAELRATPQGKQVATASIAVEDWQKKDERGKPTAEWFRIKVWGKQAESLAPHLTKGKTILAEGRLSIQTWTDKDGKSRYTPEVSVDKIVLLGGGRQNDDTAGVQKARATSGPNTDNDDQPLDEDSIPF
jgi:single-strand DNA-binding protein